MKRICQYFLLVLRLEDILKPLFDIGVRKFGYHPNRHLFQVVISSPLWEYFFLVVSIP